MTRYHLRSLMMVISTWWRIVNHHLSFFQNIFHIMRCSKAEKLMYFEIVRVHLFFLLTGRFFTTAHIVFCHYLTTGCISKLSLHTCTLKNMQICYTEFLFLNCIWRYFHEGWKTYSYSSSYKIYLSEVYVKITTRKWPVNY